MFETFFRRSQRQTTPITFALTPKRIKFFFFQSILHQLATQILVPSIFVNYWPLMQIQDPIRLAHTNITNKGASVALFVDQNTVALPGTSKPFDGLFRTSEGALHGDVHHSCDLTEFLNRAKFVEASSLQYD